MGSFFVKEKQSRQQQARENNNSPRRKRNDRPSVDNSHGLKKEKRACKKAYDEDKIPHDATISDDECADFYQHNTVRIESRGNARSNVEENNGVPPSDRSTNPEDEARCMKKCDDDRIKVQRSIMKTRIGQMSLLSQENTVKTSV